MDPRVTTPPAALARKFSMERDLAAWMAWADSAGTAAAAESGVARALCRLTGELNTLYNQLDDADAAPTSQQEGEFTRFRDRVTALKSGGRN